MLALHSTAIAFASADMPWMNRADPPSARAKALLGHMTLDEKLALFHGSCTGYVGNVCENTRLGIPAIKMNDGPQGFRDNAHLGTTTAWPCSLAIAASFDPKASEEWGAGMGEEFFAKGSNVQLGPGMCLARIPKNGRNFEYISGEDPYLGYVMVGPAVKGIQSQGVIANAKHWVNNNQESDRGSVSEVVDERTQFQLYYPPFAGAIEAGVGSVMCSYNRIRKIWSCENPETLQRDLKERLGFEGWVMSDWGATHSVAINAGLDQEMPGSGFMGDRLKAAVEAGNVTVAKVDDSATRILTPMFSVGLFDTPNKNTTANNVTSAAHNALARRLAARSLVLLKNDKELLPLSKQVRLALIGAEAKKPTVHGGGSGQVVPYYTSAPYDAIVEAVGDVRRVSYDDGSDPAKAAALAASAEVAIVFAATDSSEGRDRASLNFDHDADALIAAVAKANAKTVVAGVTPGALLTPWRAEVAAITLGFMPGQEYGHALADVLFGDTAPTAKLPLTMPVGENDLNITEEMWPGVPTPGECEGTPHANCKSALYSEKLLVGYRGYDHLKLAPAFAFGAGLTYTTFALTKLTVQKATGDGLYTVSVDVANTGARDGTETPQLYLGFPPSAGEPPSQLRGFTKVELKAGAKQTVSFGLPARALSVWDDKAHAWAEAKGTFTVTVGTSSRDAAALSATFEHA
jgi:beta-glucosidase